MKPILSYSYFFLSWKFLKRSSHKNDLFLIGVRWGRRDFVLLFFSHRSGAWPFPVTEISLYCLSLVLLFSWLELLDDGIWSPRGTRPSIVGLAEKRCIWSMCQLAFIVRFWPFIGTTSAVFFCNLIFTLDEVLNREKSNNKILTELFSSGFF
jgi:hypothetical protein